MLQWGNYVNHGVRLAAADAAEGRGNAAAATEGDEEGTAAAVTAAAASSVEMLPTRGFALPSLLKLMEFRSTVDSRLSSLHYILVNLVSKRRHQETQERQRVSLYWLTEEQPLGWLCIVSSFRVDI